MKLKPDIARLARNTVAQAGTQILLMPISLIFVMAVARQMGPDDYGVYQLALSFPMLVAALVPLGMHTFFSRDLAQRPEEARKYASYGFGLVILSAAVVYPVTELAALGMAFPAPIQAAIAVSGLSAVLGGVTVLTSSFFRAFERLELDAYLTLGERLLGVGLGLVALYVWGTPFALVSVLLVTTAVRLLASQLLLMRQIGPFALRFSREESVSLLRIGWPFLLGGYFALFYDNVALTVLAKMASPADVGTYAAAWRLVNLVNLVAIALGNAALPALARSAAAGAASVERVLRTAMAPVAFAAAAGASLIALLAEPISYLLYGDRFVDVPGVLVLLVFTAPSVFVKYLLGNTLMSMGEQPYITKVLFAAALLALTLNLLLGSIYGSRGAAVALLCAEYLTTLVLLRRLTYVGVGRHLGAIVGWWCLGICPGVLALALPVSAAVRAGVLVSLLVTICYANRERLKRNAAILIEA